MGSTTANVLGKYRLIAEIGRGGMAEVYLAVAQGPAGFNKLTVIKQIRPQIADDPEFLAMFLDEARLAARLNHPHIVQTNEVGQEGKRYFISMEYLEGQPFNRALHRVGRDRFPLALQLGILAEACAGLHYAHDLTDYDGTPLDVVHRDMTPHNIFITYEGQVKVVDFGIAKAMDSSAETRTGVLKGKIAYMAPEQARGERVDRRADIFSIGVMLWEAAVGRRLWKGLPDMAILSRMANNDIPTPRSVRAEVAPELEAVILRAMALQKEDRHPTASDLQADIERLLDQWGQRSSSREAGRLIAQHFEDERTMIRVLVEAQLKDARLLPTGEYQSVVLPVIEHPSLSAPGSGISTSKEISNPGYVPSLERSASYPNPGTLAAASTPGVSPPSGRRALLVPIAAAGGAALAVLVWLAVRGSQASEPTPQATLPPPPTASAQAAPEEIEISISAKPANAQIFLDGTLLEGNPLSRQVPRDGTAHKLRIEAPGYTTDTRSLAFDKDLRLELALEKDPSAKEHDTKEPSTARHAGQAGRSQSSSPPPDDNVKRPTLKPVRPLDTANPFTSP